MAQWSVLTFIKDEPFDLVVTDYNMPEMAQHGRELSDHLSASIQKPLPHQTTDYQFNKCKLRASVACSRLVACSLRRITISVSLRIASTVVTSESASDSAHMANIQQTGVPLKRVTSMR